MSQNQSTAYKTVGIVGLVLASLAFLFSFVPCLGMYAVWPGVAGLVLSVIALVMAGRANGGKGIAITALCLAVVGTGVAVYQYITISKGVEELSKALDTELRKSSDSLLQASDVKDGSVEKSFEEAQKAIDSLNNAAEPTPAAAQ
ncbi:hypothetical protein [Flaviaesturariibacter amylovorans]|uniref:DUF4190 domain-containing protein n=1 Tax=Flaviaesturariibacter amylovorans TaxID=1084520 RepID=A0ABP8GSW6_9BACT